MSSKEFGFDYAGERQYYCRPVINLRDWQWLSRDMVYWVPGFPDVFHDECVLDIGAGECLVTFVIAERGRARLSIALELIEHRLWAARSISLPGLALVCGDCLNMPFPNKSFDIVVGNGVLHHLPLARSVKEISRVLKPGGRYFGREPNFRNPVVRRKVLGGHHSPNEHAILPAEIQSIFRSEGFEIQIKYFWRRIPWLHNPRLSVSIAIDARLTS